MHEFGTFLHDDIPKFDRKWSKSGRYSKDNVLVLCSVVPHISRIIRSRFLARNGRHRFKIYEVGKNLNPPLRNKYNNPKKLGADRLVNLYGALRIHKPPILMIDFGTAVTFDYLSRQRIFEGGMIVPGPEIGFQSLVERAALLPAKARLPHKTLSFLGTSTYACMESGILEGYGAMTHGLIERFKARFGRDLHVITTGGFAQHLRRYIHTPHYMDPKHPIKSLLLLYKDLHGVPQKNRRKRT